MIVKPEMGEHHHIGGKKCANGKIISETHLQPLGGSDNI
jgi:hypothetical protein